jgi:hypothetical protein
MWNSGLIISTNYTSLPNVELLNGLVEFTFHSFLYNNVQNVLLTMDNDMPKDAKGSVPPLKWPWSARDLPWTCIVHEITTLALSFVLFDLIDHLKWYVMSSFITDVHACRPNVIGKLHAIPKIQRSILARWGNCSFYDGFFLIPCR